jgi:uncharacterized protein YggE
VRLGGIALALFLASGSAAAQNAPLTLQPGETLLEVQSEGEHLDRPDVMEIFAGVVTTGATAGEALAANNVAAARVIAAVRAQGVVAGDVQTSAININPRYQRLNRNDNDDEGNGPIVGYVVTNMVTVRVRDLGRASAFLDTLLAAGANTVRGPHFSLSDPGPATAAARRDSVTQSRAEAETYATALGMRISRVLRVSERNRTVGDGDGTILITGSRIGATPLEPGELTTTVRTWTDYALIPQ